MLAVDARTNALVVVVVVAEDYEKVRLLVLPLASFLKLSCADGPMNSIQAVGNCVLVAAEKKR